MKLYLLCLALLAVTQSAKPESVYAGPSYDPVAIYLTANEFHVRGDGQADDSAAIQAAIDKVHEIKVSEPLGRWRRRHLSQYLDARHLRAGRPPHLEHHYARLRL
jgi:hypothetical protein